MVVRHVWGALTGSLAALALCCASQAPPAAEAAPQAGPAAPAAPSASRAAASGTAISGPGARGPGSADPALGSDPGAAAVARLRLDPHWRITHRGSDHAIEGWADRASVLPGEPVALHVSTTAATWDVTAYRMGWYGAVGGAPVWHRAGLRGTVQPPARHDGPTSTVRTRWPTSLVLPTAQWPPGAYLLRLDSSGGQRFVPLTVRSPETAGRIVLVDGVTTWQAYNTWGGYSLYQGPGGKADFANRSTAVSFDRPYDGDGAGQFLALDLPTIAHAERLGVPLAYATDIDLHAEPTLLEGARAVVTLAHDEYWSSAMRTSVTRARDTGVNVAFLGANAVFRHIRLARTAFGPNRLEVNYKRLSDPLLGVQDSEVTTDWREPPVPRPESELTGVCYECNPVHADLVVTDPGNWLFAGTGAQAGLRLPDLVGPEYDRVNPGMPTPHGIEVLTHSPVRCRGVSSFSDSAWYDVPSGAGVFASGSIWFTKGLPEAGATGATARVVGGMLSNLLTAFAAGPAGAAHPARPNLAGLHEYAGDPVAAGNGQ